jgi:hypothetical protein
MVKKYTPPTNKWSSASVFKRDQIITEKFVGGGPNLRTEFNEFLYGGAAEIRKGFWIIHREMLLDQTSPNWNEENQESYKGYRWFYKDHLLRTREYTYPQDDKNESRDTIGDVENPGKTLFFPYDANIKKEDVIVTLKKADFESMPASNLITLEKEYRILRVDKVTGDTGRVEYLRVIVKDNTNYGNKEFATLKL